MKLGQAFDPRNNALNAFRLALATGVILWHSFPLTGHDIAFTPARQLLSSIEVDGFFAVSGFLITASWFRNPKIRDYTVARGLRILPGFYVCLMITAFVIAPIGVAIQGGSTAKLLLSTATIEYVLMNSAVWVCKNDIGGTPAGIPFPGSWNGSLWTLGWELLCYIAIAGLGVAGLFNRRWILPAAMALAVFCSAALPPIGPGMPTFAQNAARFAVVFLAGALVHRFRNAIPARWSLVAVNVVIVLASGLLPNYRVIAAIPLAYAIIVSGALIKSKRFALHTDLSYGMYIYAFPMQQLVAICGFATLNPFVFWIVATTTTLPVAALSWFLVEKPALSLKSRLIAQTSDTWNSGNPPQSTGYAAGQAGYLRTIQKITRVCKYHAIVSRPRRAAMSTQIPHFINGQRTAGSATRTTDVFNPSTGQVQAKVPMASSAEIDASVESAVEAQRDWAARNPQRRARVLMRFIELVNDNNAELAKLLSLEHGKTLADAQGDIQRGIEVIEFCIGIPHLLKGDYSEGVGPSIDVYSLRQPLGVVAGITPFNFPAMIPLWMAGPALACGNAFILKPSERDPSVPVRLAELFTEAGLPPGVCQVVHGDKEAVDAILNHPDIKAVGFVGSSDIAQYIYAGAAATGKRSQCFGGAKNHMIVMPDADLDQAVDALIGAGYGSAGERCMAISVAVPVGEQTAERLRARLIERINNLRVGHSLDPKADYGPLVTEAALARVRDYIDQGESAGAEIVVDGRERASDDLAFGDANLESGFFIGPTLFDYVTPNMSIYTDEIFGPVLCMVRAHDYEEALRLPSEHEYGNGVAIFTRDGDTARDFTARVQVGMVGVNVPIPVPVAYHTFGGWKRSGFGDLNQHGPASIQFYTKVKTVTSRWPSGVKSGAEFVIPTMG